jgi:hypothetical protein
MITYTWFISHTEWHPDTGAITAAHWRVTAQDGEHSASAYGSVGFTPNPDQDFLPLDTLTEETVLKWCWWGGVKRKEVEANLAAQIETAKNPPVVGGLPWAK